jgi:hypothetical protein
MLNRRKAMIGYAVYTLGKPIAKRQIKKKAPGKRGGIIAGSVAAVGATVAGLAIWRKRHKDEESFETP